MKSIPISVLIFLSAYICIVAFGIGLLIGVLTV